MVTLQHETDVGATIITICLIYQFFTGWLANTIIAGAMFSSLAFDIYMHIDKCCSTVKGACTKRDEFYEKRDELEAKAERIDSIYSQGKYHFSLKFLIHFVLYSKYLCKQGSH